MKKNLTTVTIIFFLFQTCKTFELKEEARNIIITKDQRIEKSSLCNQITTIAADENAKNETEKINDLKNQAQSFGGNLILSDYFKLQRPTGNGTMEIIPAFGIYNCQNPTTLITSLNNKEKEEELEERRQEEFRTDGNSHNWVICETTEFTSKPKELTNSILKQMKPKAYESKAECEKRALVSNQIGLEFGIKCICQNKVLNKR
ncbi:hypothetical protein [Leptospira levettii]|uniref:hypothetical protein n=1 Tax=Leptospira levettii TaxID=2023178 RepID=UPI00223DDD1C|nr:hypothetical protein [Leptospira levettii]MCW7475580.1 DUF4156 domain-containing protein [Leptospira levettii]